MRVLFDYNNLACRCVHLQQIHNDDERSWSLMSYMIFNTMYEFLQDVAEFLDEGDKLDVILALDSKDGYWRKDLYPPYKADRAKKRREDGVDWERAYAEFDKLIDVIGKYTPWKPIRVSKCEADDVIYALSRNTTAIIHSGDSDYLQLVSDSISLFQPHTGEYAEFPRVCKISGGEAVCRTPEDYLNYAILTGQGGKDNVYNVKTPTDWDVSKRKPGFGVKAADKILRKPLWQGELHRLGLWDNYMRNLQLISLSCLPLEYLESIEESYKNAPATSANLSGLLTVYDWPSLAARSDSMNAELLLWAEGIERQVMDIDQQPNIFDFDI